MVEEVAKKLYSYASKKFVSSEKSLADLFSNYYDITIPENFQHFDEFSDIEVVVVVYSGVTTVVVTLVVHTLVVVVVTVVSPSTGLFCTVTGTTVSTQVTDVDCVVSA
jgi:hypothetical protein